MSPDAFAILILAAYVLTAVVVVAWRIRRSTVGLTVWALYVTERLYVALWFRWRANRRCPFPPDGPAIIIANHRSPVDPLFLWMNHHWNLPGGRLRVMSFLMAREFYEKRGIKWICVAVQSIPVERSGKDAGPTRDALRRLQQGDWVGIFPEGRINTGAGLQKGNPGVAWLALRSQAPVYPVYIHNSPRGKDMVASFYTRTRVRITYGDPIDLSPFMNRRRTPELLDEITHAMMTQLGELGGEAYQPDDAADEARQIVPMQRESG
jgi:1-acyl-sn-glycerol-3-phosphate acyltransferase